MHNRLDRWFHLSENHTSVRTEVLAGFTTFSTMAYIIFVNPMILKQAGMDFGAVMVATILAAAFSTLIMALYARYPFALAPGMGLNAFFTYTLVIDQGISWQVGLGATFLAGLLFFVLNLLRIRELILEAIPLTLRVTLAAGIGLFLAFIALKQLGVIVAHPETLVTTGSLKTPEVGMALLGLVLTGLLLTFNVRGAILISLLVVWGLSLLFGLTTSQGFFSLPPDPSPTLWQLDIKGALDPAVLGVVMAFTFIAIFDAAGTITGLAEQGKFLDKEGKLPRARRVFLADALGTMIGAAVGTSPMTTYLESAAGVTAGGRTGLTGVVVSILFLLCLFVAPVAESMPFFATAPALLIIGAQMMEPLRLLSYDDPTEYLPGFVTLIAIPLTFSISTGIAFGLILYPLLKVVTGRARQVHWLVWILAVLFLLKFLFLNV
jgi:AGZA family xanthine/uracil permease-like MFS transporter